MSVLFNAEKMTILTRKCICFERLRLHSERFTGQDKQIALICQIETIYLNNKRTSTERSDTKFISGIINWYYIGLLWRLVQLDTILERTDAPTPKTMYI